MPRHEFSRKIKCAAWERCGGRCEGQWLDDEIVTRCWAPIDIGNFHYDHIDPDWFSGCNDLSNCQVLCVVCHKEKTARDQTNIAKSKRVRDKRSKALTSKRPFRFWRRFNGEIVDARKR